jgi:hypothetical protein
MYSGCPHYSYVNNIGHDGTGTHCGETHIFKNDLSSTKRACNFVKDIQLDEDVMLEFRKFYHKKPLPVLGINKIFRTLFKRDLIK